MRMAGASATSLAERFPVVCPAFFIQVTDGDTCVVKMWIPWETEPREVKIRFAGIDAPETRRQATHDELEIATGLAVKELVREMLQDAFIWVCLTSVDKWGDRLDGVLGLPVMPVRRDVEMLWSRDVEAMRHRVYVASRESSLVVPPYKSRRNGSGGGPGSGAGVSAGVGGGVAGSSVGGGGAGAGGAAGSGAGGAGVGAEGGGGGAEEELGCFAWLLQWVQRRLGYDEAGSQEQDIMLTPTATPPAPPTPVSAPMLPPPAVERWSASATLGQVRPALFIADALRVDDIHTSLAHEEVRILHVNHQLLAWGVVGEYTGAGGKNKPQFREWWPQTLARFHV